MESYNLTHEDNPADHEMEIFDVLREYNVSQVGESNYRKLTIFLRNEQGEVIGGVQGSTSRGWLHITNLVLRPEVRGQGWGTTLLGAAEKEAISRGCHHAYLDTFSFQALPFYQKQGYTIFGTLEDYPEGHSNYFLKKRLDNREA
ncbi:MAG: GNAT family N-acetyltransferase [Abitibacteriaceae bacterium]|nr:GNAT family N-acetyltransferase [Abditibacteriaceae bacterium]MBV9868617.1 GNAT family N-acetyltransferase [Abditibacteriaceae bacterium]